MIELVFYLLIWQIIICCQIQAEFDDGFRAGFEIASFANAEPAGCPTAQFTELSLIFNNLQSSAAAVYVCEIF